MITHELKIHRSVWEDVFFLRKTFEFRKNDRDFKVGDILKLRWYDPDSKSYGIGYPTMFFKITYIIHGPEFGIPEGYCIMSIKPQ